MGIDALDLRGLWEREVITYRKGTMDSSKMILWMQARSLYADIRIPRDLAPLPRELCLDDLDHDGLVELARCGGFGGTIRMQRSTCYWDRDVDWQPDTGVPDVAELALEGPDLIENGGACGGHQVWRRLTTPRCAALGVRLQDAADGRSGFLVAAEGRFVYIRGRAVAAASAVAAGPARSLRRPRDRQGTLRRRGVPRQARRRPDDARDDVDAAVAGRPRAGTLSGRRHRRRRAGHRRPGP